MTLASAVSIIQPAHHLSSCPLALSASAFDDNTPEQPYERSIVSISMKFSSLALPAILATAVTARSTSFFGGSDVTANDDGALKVPGENPLQHCEDPKDDILAIKSVDLSPNPPKACV